MADFSKQIALAQRLIAKNGRFVTFQKLGKASADPSKPWNGVGAPQVEALAENVKAAFLPASGGGLGSIIKNEDLLKRVEQVALVAPHAQDLAAMNKILDDQLWGIEWVEVLRPAEQVILYIFGVKR